MSGAPRNAKSGSPRPRNPRRKKGAGSRPDAAYEVGYGRPPACAQFKKGVSGNPRGRPRGSKSLKTLIRNALEATVEVKDGLGRRRTLPVVVALLQKQIELGLKGSDRSTLAIIKLAEQFGAMKEVEGDDESALSPAENALLEDLLSRLTQTGTPGGDE